MSSLLSDESTPRDTRNGVIDFEKPWRGQISKWTSDFKMKHMPYVFASLRSSPRGKCGDGRLSVSGSNLALFAGELEHL